MTNLALFKQKLAGITAEARKMKSGRVADVVRAKYELWIRVAFVPVRVHEDHGIFWNNSVFCFMI